MRNSRSKSLKSEVDQVVAEIARQRRKQIRIDDLGRLERAVRFVRTRVGRTIGRFGLLIGRPFVALGTRLCEVPVVLSEAQFDAVIEETRRQVYKRAKAQRGGRAVKPIRKVG